MITLDQIADTLRKAQIDFAEVRGSDASFADFAAVYVGHQVNAACSQGGIRRIIVTGLPRREQAPSGVEAG